MNYIINIRDNSKIGKEYLFNIGFTNINFEQAVDLIRNARGSGSFRYVVTPNVDHIVRLRRDGRLSEVYRGAWLSLCDSKPISWLSRLLFCRLHLVTGSDLTSRLFHAEIRAKDKVVLIAPYAEVGEKMAATFPDVEFHWHIPPQGVVDDPAALQACADFAVRHKPNYVFIAIGSPQSELIAHRLSTTPGATGIGICCGASLEFITQLKKRAPMVMQRLCLEWLHRLLSDPRRLWRRYVFAVGPLIGLFLGEAGRRISGRGSPPARPSGV